MLETDSDSEISGLSSSTSSEQEEDSMPDTASRAKPASSLLFEDNALAAESERVSGRVDNDGSSSQLDSKDQDGREVKGLTEGSGQSSHSRDHNRSCSSSETAGQLWQREKDQLILEMVRDHGNNQDTYATIASRIRSVTPAQVAERLAFLMEVLQTSSDDDDGNDD